MAHVGIGFSERLPSQTYMGHIEVVLGLCNGN